MHLALHRNGAASIRYVLAIACAIASGGPAAGAQGTSPDSLQMVGDSVRPATKKISPWVTRRDALVLGSALAATVAIAPFDKPVENEFAEPNWKNNRLVHRVANDVAFLGGDGPFAASAALFAAGSVGGHSALQRFAIHNMEAIALATVVTGIGKGITGRALPGVKTKHAFQFGRGFHEANGPFVSFPSGHTAAAFAIAATVTGEADSIDSLHAQLIGRIAFGAAAAVGVARLAQRVHWPSDLPLAVVVGVWSGRTVQAHAQDGGRVGALLHGLTVAHESDGRTRVGWTSATAFGTNEEYLTRLRR